MAAPVALYANSSSWRGMAIETTYGTPVAAPVYWVPVKSPKISAMITEVDDDALRGSMVKNYMQIPTVRHDEYTFTTYVYYDTLPALIRSILGGTDVITGSADPYTHTLSLLNNSLATANQPPSYTFFDFDGKTCRQLPAGQVDELSIKFTATGLVELTVKVLSFPFTTIAAPSSAFTAVTAAPSWDCTPTINSVVNVRVVDGEISLKRSSKPLHVLGQQAPYKIQVGPLEIDGKMTFLNTDDSELGWYTADSTVPVNLVFTPPQSTTHTWTIDMNACKAKNAVQERGADGVIVTSFDLVPLPNTTDANSGGVSPIKSTHLTALSTSY